MLHVLVNLHVLALLPACVPASLHGEQLQPPQQPPGHQDHQPTTVDTGTSDCQVRVSLKYSVTEKHFRVTLGKQNIFDLLSKKVTITSKKILNDQIL